MPVLNKPQFNAPLNNVTYCTNRSSGAQSRFCTICGLCSVHAVELHAKMDICSTFVVKSYFALLFMRYGCSVATNVMQVMSNRRKLTAAVLKIAAHVPVAF